jgi:hypothetical protein
VSYLEEVWDVRIVTPLRLGIFGGLSLAAGLAWFAIWYRSVYSAMQWNVDVRAPYALRLIVIVSFWVVVASVVWAAAIWLRRRGTKARS